jgi:hypothetical protein
MNVNQKGFAAVEALLLLVLLAIIGGTGYYVWHARQNSNDIYSSSTGGSNRVAVPSSPQISKKTSQLSTYTSKYTGASFDFPSSWHAKVQITPQYKKDIATISSPSNGILIYWSGEILGVGSSCTDTVSPGKTSTEGDPGCPAWKNTSIEPLGYGHGLSVVSGYSKFDDNKYGVYTAIQAPDSELVTSSVGAMFTFFQFNGHRSDLSVGVKGSGLHSQAFSSPDEAANFMLTNKDFKAAQAAVSSLRYQ